MSNTTTTTRAPVIVFSHGGGPMPLLGDPSHAEIVSSLRTKVPKILHLDTPSQPRAIALVTAHWSEPVVTISNGPSASLLYDYYGFPPESYAIKYPAPTSPAIAEAVFNAMRAHGLPAALDSERGWDHGVFVPMKLVRPQADIPIVQISLLASEDPAQHLAMGRALATLRDQGVAIVGSGFASLHNIRAMMTPLGQTPEFRAKNDAWSAAVNAAMDSDGEGKFAALEQWRTWPHSYLMHPRGGAEHFLPLIVGAGAGGDAKPEYYKDRMNGFDMYSYYWS